MTVHTLRFKVLNYTGDLMTVHTLRFKGVLYYTGDLINMTVQIELLVCVYDDIFLESDARNVCSDLNRPKLSNTLIVLTLVESPREVSLEKQLSVQ